MWTVSLEIDISRAMRVGDRPQEVRSFMASVSIFGGRALVDPAYNLVSLCFGLQRVNKT